VGGPAGVCRDQPVDAQAGRVRHRRTGPAIRAGRGVARHVRRGRGARRSGLTPQRRTRTAARRRSLGGRDRVREAARNACGR
jgi:hypothetical protein